MDYGLMHKDVGRTIVGDNKAKALFRVEPLDGAVLRRHEAHSAAEEARTAETGLEYSKHLDWLFNLFGSA